MIPPDVASALRLVLPDQQSVTNAQTQPVASAQRVADVLSNLVPGQRILAEIQSMLLFQGHNCVIFLANFVLQCSDNCTLLQNV